MKILFVVQNYYPSTGGTQIFFQHIAEKCANDYGDTIEIFTTNSYYGPDKRQFRKILKKTEIINKVTITRFPFFRIHLLLFGYFSKIFFRLFHSTPEKISKYIAGPWSPSLQKAIKKTNADVIFAGTSNYMYMLYPLNRKLLKSPKPFVFQGAIHFNENKKVKVISEEALNAIKHSEFYLSNTDYEKERLIELGVDKTKIITAGSCVDFDRFSKGNKTKFRDSNKINEREILVGYIGRIESTKSIDILLNAIKICFHKKDNITLIIAGYSNSEYLAKLKTQVKDFEIKFQSRIHFITDLSEDTKVDLFLALDIFVLPSVNESFGMVFLEAWACNKPVIGAEIGAIKSVISDGTDGLLFKPNDSVDLSDKIITLCENKSLRDEMGANGYRKAFSNFSIEAVTKKYRDTFIKAKEVFHVH